MCIHKGIFAQQNYLCMKTTVYFLFWQKNKTKNNIKHKSNKATSYRTKPQTFCCAKSAKLWSQDVFSICRRLFFLTKRNKILHAGINLAWFGEILGNSKGQCTDTSADCADDPAQHRDHTVPVQQEEDSRTSPHQIKRRDDVLVSTSRWQLPRVLQCCQQFGLLISLLVTCKQLKNILL